MHSIFLHTAARKWETMYRGATSLSHPTNLSESGTSLAQRNQSRTSSPEKVIPQDAAGLSVMEKTLRSPERLDVWGPFPQIASPWNLEQCSFMLYFKRTLATILFSQIDCFLNIIIHWLSSKDLAHTNNIAYMIIRPSSCQTYQVGIIALFLLMSNQRC